MMNDRVQNHLRGTLASSVFLVFFLAFSFILIHDASADETTCPSKRYTYHMIDVNGDESDAIMLDVFQVKDALAGDRILFPKKMLDEQKIISHPEETKIGRYNYLLYDHATLFKFYDSFGNVFFLTPATPYGGKRSHPQAIYFDRNIVNVHLITVVGIRMDNDIAYTDSFQGNRTYPEHINNSEQIKGPAQFIALTNDYRSMALGYSAFASNNEDRIRRELFQYKFFKASGTWKFKKCAS